METRVQMFFLCVPQNLKDVFYSLLEIMLIDQSLPNYFLSKVKKKSDNFLKKGIGGKVSLCGVLLTTDCSPCM